MSSGSDVGESSVHDGGEFAICKLSKLGVTTIPESHPEKRRRWKLPIGCVAAIALLFGVGYYIHCINQSVRNSYAVWWVADMVVEHMKANDNRWPGNWGDLRDDYQTCMERSGQSWSFAELASRTQIDWQANPSRLLAESKGNRTAEFRVISLSDGTDSHWQRREPNQIILDYIRSSVMDQQAC